MASKDQRRCHQAIKGRVHQTHTPSRMDSQCCACTQERCESENMCKGLEQSLP